MAKIACIGHTTLDIIFFLREGHVHKIDLPVSELCVPFPSKCWVDRRVVSLGGNAPNAGAGLLKSGHEVKLISQVGDDELGKIILSYLRDNSFDLTYISIEGESDTSVILSWQGDRTILAYHVGVPYRFPSSLKDVGWLYLSSLGLEDFKPFFSDLLRWTDKNPDVNIVYNPGRAEIAAGIKSIKELLHKTHTLILNRQEAAQILGVDQKTIPESSELLDQLIRFGIARVIITDGVAGSHYATAKNRYQANILKSQVVDSTGAGDAFSSGYLSGLAFGRNPVESLKVAVVQSSNVLTEAGATRGLLTINQIDEILAKQPDIRVQEIPA